MVNLRGKWALVTGAARGIGRLAAVFLAENGSGGCGAQQCGNAGGLQKRLS